MWKLLLFHTEMISAQFLWRNVLLGELQIDAKKLNSFKIFENALYYENWEYALKLFS